MEQNYVTVTPCILLDDGEGLVWSGRGGKCSTFHQVLCDCRGRWRRRRRCGFVIEQSQQPSVSSTACSPPTLASRRRRLAPTGHGTLHQQSSDSGGGRAAGRGRIVDDGAARCPRRPRAESAARQGPGGAGVDEQRWMDGWTTEL